MRILGRLALVLAAFAVALGLCEVLLRAAGFSHDVAQSTAPVWPWVVYDPILHRKNRPGFVDEAVALRIDSHGFRNDEVAARKRPGSIRIACLGDSATFGIWKAGYTDSLETSYPAELARLLAAEGRTDVEVINAGVLGHTTGEGLAQLLTVVLPLAPDVVTIRYGSNDHLLRRTGERPPATYPWDYTAMRLLPAPAFRAEVVRLGFHAYRRGLAGQSPPRGFHHLVPIEAFERNLRRFVRIGRAYGVKLLFVDFPYRALERGLSPDQTYPNVFTEATSLADFHAIHDRYQAVLARVADATGTPFLRTRDALQRAATPSFSDFDISHPNRAGAELLARELRGELARLGWLPSAARAD